MCRSERRAGEPSEEISNNGSGNFLSIKDIPDVVRGVLEPIHEREGQLGSPTIKNEANNPQMMNLKMWDYLNN